MNICGFDIGNHRPFFLIAGNCVIEDEATTMHTAETLREICDRLAINLIYKSSFDKANRSSLGSFRGHGLAFGLKVLRKVKEELGLPIITDVHEDTALDEVASVVDLLQTPAFLCRQTNFIQRVCGQGRPVNIKKGQFLAPWDMEQVANKALATGNRQILLCERGASFGYNNLVSDMRSLEVMKGFNLPVVYDATHSVQQPGGLGTSSGGQRQFVPALARAAVAVGVAGIFMETHPDPDRALSDGPNAVPLGEMAALLQRLQALDRVLKDC